VTSIDVRIQQLENGAGLPLPAYKTADAAGCDLAAAVADDAPLVVPPGGRALVPTGIAIALPAGFEGQVRPRSGLSIEYGVTVINAPGTIDADYRGEIQVPIVNLGAEPFSITRGMRVAQLVIAPVTRARFVSVDELTSTSRGASGFGSTGLSD
jgi:dUTP pyrophosphatase